MASAGRRDRPADPPDHGPGVHRRRTAQHDEAKRTRITEQGGACLPADPPLAVYDRARAHAADSGGHYLDHFTDIAETIDSRTRTAPTALPPKSSGT
ncbi:hypothetical protein [Saccharopolyspora pogona]|uniref:hypothetical protein n=1 Tax=Saccharopolyspora pogona TaxID=333966 RepID=UPI001CC26BC1|nr:hypothetical protein [Saccharopolyspora pogona]